MAVKVKICGVTNPKDARAAAALGAWAVGIIMTPASERCVPAATARKIIEALPGTVKTVGVFMDQPLELVRAISTEAGFDFIQLHGDESPDYVQKIGPERVIKTLTLGRRTHALTALDPHPAWVLIDRPKGDDPIVDLGRAREIARVHPQTLLAGGLTPEGVGQVLARVWPWGVDVSSGVERSPGVKDHARMKDFFDAVAAWSGAQGGER